MSETNRFGGGNANSVYVPMSDDEQEVLMRLVESQTLRIHVHGWGMEIVPQQVGYGDKRVQVTFQLDFDRPKVPIRVPSLNLELRTADGLCLFRKPYPTFGDDGKPMQIAAGMSFQLVWDIAIDHMDPALVKTLKPGALGLTTRRLDKDTGERTLQGNMKLDLKDGTALFDLEKVEEQMRQMLPINPKQRANDSNGSIGK